MTILATLLDQLDALPEVPPESLMDPIFKVLEYSAGLSSLPDRFGTHVDMMYLPFQTGIS